MSYARTMTVFTDRAASGNRYANWRDNPNDRYQGILWGNLPAGRYATFAQIVANMVDNGNGNRAVLPGDYYYGDWNGDGYIDANDDHPLYPNSGNPNADNTPLINYGLNMGINYKNFDLDVLFQGVAMKRIQYGDVLSMPFVFANSNTLQAFTNRWHPVDPAADPYNPNTEYVSGLYPFTGGPFFTIQNAAYVRLKTLTLGYTIPARLISRVGLKSARAYINGYNLFTITDLKIVDPEHPADNNSYIYPLNKTYNVGLTVTF
jgi:hypothetical protein